MFYHPTDDQIKKISGSWCASYSGGKDSTSLVTWIEWLRRSDKISVDQPALVQSDTGVEDPALMAISQKLTETLTKSGWQCALVRPAIHERLYCRILGIGNIPIHPGISSMRWCTRSTKIDPMTRWRKEQGRTLVLTGLRMGESKMRDGKLKKRGCAAGGECGIPDPDEHTYSPIINWSLCNVISWLNGEIEKEVSGQMCDLFDITKELICIYDVVIRKYGFEFAEPQIKAARFGCIGCPAISATRTAPKSVIARNGIDSPLNELYDVWFEARHPSNRLWSKRCKKQFGPIKMESRKKLFDSIMDIQSRSGVILITEEDENFIRKCWEDKVYPRGWSAKDEETMPPSNMPLFDGLHTIGEKQ